MSKKATTKPPVLSKRANPILSKKMDISLDELLNLYERECRIKNLADVTIKGYDFAFKAFMKWCNKPLSCSDITQDLINSYILYLSENFKPQTVNSYQFKISPVIKFGTKNGYIKDTITFTHCVEQEHIKQIYTDEELRTLLKRPTGNSFAEYRCWVIINLLLATGVRAAELRSILIKDVDLDNGVLSLPHTKNRKPRLIPIPSSLNLILFEYLQTRNGAPNEPLFCNIYGEPLPRTTLQISITKYCKKRGVEKHSLHLFRHTFITLSVRNGMSPILLKRITGHQSFKILNEYYQFDISDLTEVVDAFNPLEKFKQKKKLF